METKFETGTYVILCQYDEIANHYGIAKYIWERLQGVCKIEYVEPDYVSISSPRTTCPWWVGNNAVTPLRMQDSIQYDLE